MYEVFAETEDPHVETSTTQQTPNPAAQFPVEVPPFEEHSELARQVP